MSDDFDREHDQDEPLVPTRRRSKPKTQADAVTEAHGRVMATPDGRTVMWHHLQALGVFNDAFALDQRLTDYNLGQRRAALSILAYLREACPEYTATMLREHMT